MMAFPALLEILPDLLKFLFHLLFLERLAGLEPASTLWQSVVLTLLLQPQKIYFMLTSRQRRLLEARDPNYEKQIEPKLRAPISMYSGYISPQKKIQRKLSDLFGSLPTAPSSLADPQDYSSPRVFHHSETPKNPYPSGTRPKGYTPSSVGPGDLNRAMTYWLKEFHGGRWPALEQAFLNRARSYTGGGGDFVRPRMSVFKYLGNLKEPWPEGAAMIEKMLATGPLGNFLKDNNNSPVVSRVLQYLIRNRIQIKSVTDTANRLLAAEKQPPSGDEDEDILTATAARKFDDYGALGSALREYAKVFNLDGQNWEDPEAAYKEQARLGKMCQSCKKRPMLPNDSLCGTCSRLRAQGQL